jgi:hypothetical protein
MESASLGSSASSSPSISVTLGSETRSLDSESTSLSGFVVRDDDPMLADEAESARRLLDFAEDDDEDGSSDDSSLEKEIASALAALRNGSRS